MKLVYVSKTILIYDLSNCIANMDLKFNKVYLQGITVDYSVI